METGPDGRFSIEAPATGTYLISVTREGFSEAAQTVVIDDLEQKVDVPLSLEVGSLATAVVVTASRAERDTKQIPLHVDTITKSAVEQTNQTSTGDALTMAANITPVGNGPFGVRPRLRGLDSTRLLVLVDGERLNTARQATDRTGAEVGLVSPDAISRMEVVNGAGTLMYGSDALAGTINIITNESSFTPHAAVPLRLQRLLQLERERHARHRHHRRDGAELHAARPGRRRETTTTTRPAISTSRTRGPTSTPACWTRRTPSTTTSGSTSAPSPSRSTRPTCAPTTRC